MNDRTVIEDHTSSIEQLKAGWVKAIACIDRERLRAQVQTNTDFPHFCIDDFLEHDFAARVCEEFPSFEAARDVGRTFQALNERNKVQTTDPAAFPEPVWILNEILSSPEWLETVGYALQIPHLIADAELVGGGMHQMGNRGRLDVHIDFNYIEARGLFRRVNILTFFNREWPAGWGGELELWDPPVKRCLYSYAPRFNRCVAFETTEVSYHGVTRVRCPTGWSRKSFAAYYYTLRPPEQWTGEIHSTVFKPRPDEYLKGYVAMPSQRIIRRILRQLRGFKARLGSGGVA